MISLAAKREGRFRVALALWLVVWLLMLVLLFSGLQFTIGTVELRTLKLDGSFIAVWWPFISEGVLITLELAVISIVCASMLAFAAALARLSRIPSINSLAGLYISIIRGTPLFLQFLFIYWALPQLGLVLTSMQAAIAALSLNYGAYMSEIFRAGIQAVSSGQTEAASALGMTPSQTMRRIVLPQAIRIVVPDIGNQFIAMQKDTALASAIAVEELMGRARQAGLPRQHFFEALVVAAAWYWLMTIVMTYFQGRLEHRFARSDRAT
jgi:polar amino acid transport system permease protein